MSKVFIRVDGKRFSGVIVRQKNKWLITVRVEKEEWPFGEWPGNRQNLITLASKYIEKIEEYEGESGR